MQWQRILDELLRRTSQERKGTEECDKSSIAATPENWRERIGEKDREGKEGDVCAASRKNKKERLKGGLWRKAAREGERVIAKEEGRGDNHEEGTWCKKMGGLLLRGNGRPGV